MWLKSTQNLIFITYIIKNMLDLSKEVSWVHFGQEGSKLQDLKVGARRGSNPDRSKSSDSLYKLAKNVASNPKGLDIFWTANFDGL